MLPSLNQWSPGVGVFSADWANTVVQAGGCLVANLRQFTGIQGMMVGTVGQTAPGDGYGRFYFWNETSTATDDGLNIIIPYGVTAGCWQSVIYGGGTATGNIAVVQNIAGLRALSTGATPVYVLGYYTAGDGGGGLFNITSGGGGDNGSTTIVATGGYTYQRDSLGEPISIMAFGAFGNGVTDDSPAFNAIQYGLPNGGTVLLPPGKKFTILNNANIATGITIKGPYENIGEVAVTHAANIPWSTYVNMTIAPTATLYMLSSSTIAGCLIYAYGMSFPTTSSASFGGTAFTVSGDNVMIRNSLIMGFNMAITSTNFDRLTIEDVCFDNNNNISITNSNDTAKIFHTHAWPFSADSPSQTGLTRTGNNIALYECTDSAMITDCFCYGYAVGYLLSDSGACTLKGCDADGPSTGISSTTIGISVTGTTYAGRCQIFDCQIYEQGTGIGYYNTSGPPVIIQGCTMLDCATAIGAAQNTVGILLVKDNNIASCTNGILVAATTIVIDIDGNRLEGITGTPISSTVSTVNMNVTDSNRFGEVGSNDGIQVSNNVFVPTVTPANSICALPVVGSVFMIAAGQNFGTVSGVWGGRVVYLIFAGATQIFSGGSGISGITLNGGATYTTTAGSTLILANTGNGWFEMGRG